MGLGALGRGPRARGREIRIGDPRPSASDPATLSLAQAQAMSLQSWAPPQVWARASVASKVARCLGANACGRAPQQSRVVARAPSGAGAAFLPPPARAWGMRCHPRRPWFVVRPWRLLRRFGKFFVTAQTYLMSDGWTGANSLRTTIGGSWVDPPAVVGDMGIFEPGPPPSKPRALRGNGHRNEGLRAFESN